MRRVEVIIGSAWEPAQRFLAIAQSDRAAVGLALGCGDAVTCRHAANDHDAACYGLAAGCAHARPLDETSLPEFELAIVGLGALERLGGLLAGKLAEHRQATLVVDVLEVGWHDDRLKVLKDIGRGCREEWLIAGPAVVVVSAAAHSGGYVSRFKRQMAELRTSGASARDQSPGGTEGPTWQPARPRVQAGIAQALGGAAEERLSRAFGLSAMAAAGRGRVIAADAATCARHLLRYLAHHGFLPEAAGIVPAAADDTGAAAQPSTAAGAEQAASPDAADHPADARRRGPRRPGERAGRATRRPRRAS